MATGSGTQPPVAVAERTAVPPRPLPTTDNNDALHYVAAEDLPIWLRRSIPAQVIGLMFGIDIVESENNPPHLRLHAWAVYQLPERLIRPSQQVAECCAIFPYTVESGGDGDELLDMLERCPTETLDFIREGLGMFLEVQKRMWNFVGVRSDGTHANCDGVTRARNPSMQLLDWADSVGGRLCSSWERLVAVNQRGMEREPERFLVRLRAEGVTIREVEVFALNHSHAALAVTQKLRLASAYRRRIDRLVVRDKGISAAKEFAIEEFYTDGEVRDALKELAPKEQRDHAAVRSHSAVITASDAQLVRQMSRDWFRHPLRCFALWQAERSTRPARLG